MGPDDSAGGIYIDDTRQTAAGGLFITPFIGVPQGHERYNVPDWRSNPRKTITGIISKDVAITRLIEDEDATLPDGTQKNDGTEYTSLDLSCRIWIRDGFSEISNQSPWIFARAQSKQGREIYTAIRTVLNGNEFSGVKDGGSVYVCQTGDDYMI